VVPDGAGEKMSEVIQDFAEPLLEGAESPQEINKALLIAMVAWNYSLLDDAARSNPDPAQAAILSAPGVKEVFEALLRRKEQLYPDNRRAILDYELIPSETEFRLNVISTFS